MGIDDVSITTFSLIHTGHDRFDRVSNIFLLEALQRLKFVPDIVRRLD